MVIATRALALVTGASSGLGLELAKCCANHGFDLLIASDEPEIDLAAQTCRDLGAMVMTVRADLSTIDGVDKVWTQVQACGQPVEMLLANAGRGLGNAFLDQDFPAIHHALDTSVLGTIYLLHKIGNEMRTRGTGRILITGSIAGAAPGAFQAVYHGTKAFLDSFSLALRNELQDTGVTVTCLMPDTTDADPAGVARQGFEAMMNGDQPSHWQITPGQMAEPRRHH